MGNFRWDGGAKRKDLDDSCPTDSAVIMHCLATYLDSQLPAFTDRPDRRPFTGQVCIVNISFRLHSSHVIITLHFICLFLTVFSQVPREASAYFESPNCRSST